MTTTESDRSTMVGVFEDQAQAEQAVNELRSAGFSDDQISLLVRSAHVTSEDTPIDEQRPDAEEEATAAEMIPSVFKSKSEVSRAIVTVQAEGREQEALSILHRNGANNANIPDALEADLAPIIGTETEDTGRKQKLVIKAPARDDFFDAPGGSSTSGSPPAP